MSPLKYEVYRFKNGDLEQLEFRKATTPFPLNTIQVSALLGISKTQLLEYIPSVPPLFRPKIKREYPDSLIYHLALMKARRNGSVVITTDPDTGFTQLRRRDPETGLIYSAVLRKQYSPP